MYLGKRGLLCRRMRKIILLLLAMAIIILILLLRILTTHVVVKLLQLRNNKEYKLKSKHLTSTEENESAYIP